MDKFFLPSKGRVCYLKPRNLNTFYNMLIEPITYYLCKLTFPAAYFFTNHKLDLIQTLSEVTYTFPQTNKQLYGLKRKIEKKKLVLLLLQDLK